MLPYIDTPFGYLAAKLGASTDELKLIVSFLLSFPFAGLLKRIPDARPAYKNLFIIGIGLFYLIGLFDLWTGLRTLLIASSGSYAIAYYGRGSPWMPWIGLAFLMGHMSANQLTRQFANAPSVVDITGAQMVLVLKLSAFCWNVADGALPKEQLSDFQKDRALTELPSLLDFAGYVLFFPALLAGPACDFAEYRRWLDTTMFDVPANVDPSKKPPTRRKRKIPRSGTPAAIKAAAGLFWLGLFLALSGMYPASYLASNEYLQFGFFRRVFTVHMFGFTARTKYYAVWSLAEGACILAGLGYNGVDSKTGRVSWDRMQQIRPMGVELAENSRAYLENWNIKTNIWLRNYIYLRVTPRGKKPGFRASMATFVTSAIWHGFYPGYYLSFVFASFVQTVAKNHRRYIRPFFIDPATQQPLSSKIYYDAASLISTQLIFSFAATPFVLLEFKESLQSWISVYFYGIFGVGASLAIFATPVKKNLKKKLEARAARAAGTTPAAKRGELGMQRNISTDSLRDPIMGLSADPERDIDEAMQEIKEEVERRKKIIEAEKARLGSRTKVA